MNMLAVPKLNYKCGVLQLEVFQIFIESFRFCIEFGNLILKFVCEKSCDNFEKEQGKLW